MRRLLLGPSSHPITIVVVRLAAFTQRRSDGMKHLATLGLAGVTHVHLLPAFDFATTNEDKSAWATPSSASRLRR